MTALQRCLVWFGGYSPRTVAASPPEDIEQITKIGGAILFASVVAFINWGVAGWVYSEGAEVGIRSTVVVIAALFGFFMAVLFDRSFIYFADTATEKKGIKIVSFAIARVAIIVAIGSITSQTTTPLVLKSELTAHALQMTEMAEKTRIDELKSRFHVEEQTDAINEVTEEVGKLQVAAQTLPPDIQQRINAANKCWADYNAKRAELLNGGLSAAEVDERLSGQALSCKSKSRATNAERNAYYSRTRTQLDQAISLKNAKEQELAEIKTSISDRVDNAKKVETESFNPRSTVVQWSLLSSNAGAFWKWAFVSFLLLVLELVPLLLKFMAGQSNIGRRIAKRKTLMKFQMDREEQESEHQFAISTAVHNSSKTAINEVSESPEVRAVFTKIFASYVSAIAPIEAVNMMMREFEARHVNQVEFMSRFPNYAAIIAQAWSKAVKESSEILARV